MDVTGDSVEFAIYPERIIRVARELARRMEAVSSLDFVVGFSPGGIAIALATGIVLKRPVVIAYRSLMDLPREISFSEPHADDNRLYLYGGEPGMRMLLIDDEVNSGWTLVNAARALRGASMNVVGVGSAVEVLHDGISHGRLRLVQEHLDLKSVEQIEVGRDDRVASAPTTRESGDK